MNLGPSALMVKEPPRRRDKGEDGDEIRRKYDNKLLTEFLLKGERGKRLL
jgi:hypothetical protein